VPMVSPELKPRGFAWWKFQPADPYRRGPYCGKSLRDRGAHSRTADEGDPLRRTGSQLLRL